MRRRPATPLLIALALLLDASPVLAEGIVEGGPFRAEITVDAGAGTVAASGLRLSATVGQPDALRLDGGQFRIDGGHWRPALIAPADPIFRNGFEQE